MFKQIVLSALIGSASAHVTLWDKGQFGYNWPAQATDTQNYNNNLPVTPLRQDAFLTEDQWFGHGYKGFPPKDGDFMILPAGGSYVGEIQCNRAGTRMRDPSQTAPLPKYACDGEGALHTVNRFNATVDPKWFGGTALAIAYTSDINALKPNDLTVISVNYQSPWFRETTYPIPAGLPPCPAGGCLCSWNWIHQQGNGEGYGPEIYNMLYRCKVTGSTDSTKKLSTPSIPKDCTGNPSGCMKGPKTPMYLWMASGNNLPDLNYNPNYNMNWGFMDGAQTDIFATPTSPEYTSPTATALPTGWTSMGCYKDQDPRTLPNFLWSRANNTIQSCVAGCAKAGNTYAGVEGNECWCASSSPILVSADPADCKKICPGDTWSTCGGDYRLNVYKAPKAPSAMSVAPSTTPIPVPTSIGTVPAGWSRVGCVIDDPNTRTLYWGAVAADNMTIPTCLAMAQAKGAAYAGVEYGRECWMGSIEAKANIKFGSGCNVACAGDLKTICGGPYLLSLFSNNAVVGGAAVSSTSSVRVSSSKVSSSVSRTSSTVTKTSTSTAKSSTASKSSTTSSKASSTIKSTSTSSAKPSSTTSKTTSTAAVSSKAPTPSSSTVALPSGWKDLGCHYDSPRVLNGYYVDNGKSNSAQKCINLCASKGFQYAGTEYSTQCFCGNSATLKPTTGCDSNCPDGSGKCGGAYRISLYTNTTTTVTAKRHLHRRRVRFPDRGNDFMGIH